MKLEDLSDKELHCLSRIIQDEMLKENVKCLYCKYAGECAKEWNESRNVLFIELLEILHTKTGVCLTIQPETKQKEILHGSWLKEHPDLYTKFIHMSLEEQQKELTNSDILKYLDSRV